MTIHEIADLLRNDGRVTLNHAGHSLTLDLAYRHEKLYAAKLLTGLAYPQADIDTMLINRFVRPGDRVLDAGANIGFTALEFIAAGADHVTAMEPVFELAQRLDTLQSDRLLPLKQAIGAVEGSAEIFVSEAHNQGSSLNEAIKDLFPTLFGIRTETVDITTVDALAQAGAIFDIWKLDIEGAEADALKGACATLIDSPPRAIIAELYEPFLPDFLQALPDTFSFRRRAYLSEAGYELLLVPIDRAPVVPIHLHSPMYVFALEDH
ncbi:MAG: FkbM family methyltransferase [Sphingomonas fennica]